MLALAAGMRTANAQSTPGLERPRVSINMVGCDAALAREAQRIAAIELRATLVDRAPDAHRDASDRRHAAAPLRRSR